MDKREYFDRAAAEVSRAKQRLPHFAGECAACRWSRQGAYEMVCEHPAVVCAAFNATDASAKEYLQLCDEQRDKRSVWGPVLCGPDGALFEQEQKPQRPWWLRLFGASA